MKLTISKFHTDEEFSNHMVQGYSHPDCPFKRGCFGQVQLGKIFSMCDYFKSTDKEAFCEYDGNEGLK